VLENHPKWNDPLPFAYESTGTETRFTNRLDPVPASRNIFAFHRPETLIEWAQQSGQLNQRLRDLLTTDQMPTTNLWSAQIEAIRNLEKSLAENKRRSLVLMDNHFHSVVRTHRPNLSRWMRANGRRATAYLQQRQNL
jgi:type I restriction enzyme, R subunit